MKITLVLLVLNQQEVTQKCLDTLRSNEVSADIPLLIIDNGSNPPVRDWLVGLRDGDNVVRNGENEGVVKGMRQAWRVAGPVSDYLFFLHNDVLIHQKGWDRKLQEVLATLPDCGCAGFYGAKGIGTPDIYRAPYVMQQMIRRENVSNCNRMNAAVHGFRNIRYGADTEKVAVLDGFSLIVRTELLDKIGGFDPTYPPHHMYDNDICMESMDKGYSNYVISMDAEHMGGKTDVLEDWNKNFGKSKAEIHRDAHPVFYNKWSQENQQKGIHKISLPVYVAV